MKDADIIYADPMLKKTATSLPEGARFVCSYDVHCIVDFFTEDAFFRRTETADELWTATAMPGLRPLSHGTASAKKSGPGNPDIIGCVFAVKRRGGERTACLRLLDLSFRSRFAEFPDKFLAPGIVDKAAYDNILRRIKQEHEANRRKALKNEIELIKVARELGLSPRPTGRYPDQWQAHCPGGNHPIYISTTEKYFFCGWCRRKGDRGLAGFCERTQWGIATDILMPRKYYRYQQK